MRRLILFPGEWVLVRRGAPEAGGSVSVTRGSFAALLGLVAALARLRPTFP